MAKTVVTQEMIKEINELYTEIKTYAGVARKIGIAPTTVKKYVIPGYTSEKEITKIIFDKSKLSEEIDYSLFKNKDNWGDLCVLSDDERKEIKELWKELLM